MKKKQISSFEGFIDTTLRDGQQSPLMFDSGKYRFSLADKKSLLNGLIQLGIRRFEFFSPAVSKAEKSDFLELKKFISQTTEEKVSLFAHVRCHPKDIGEAIIAGFDGLNMYMGIAQRAQKYSHGYSFTNISKFIKETIISVRLKYPHLSLRFSVEDCFRTPPSDTFRIYDTIYPYIDTFGMPDTVGVATPVLVKHHVAAFKKRYPKAMLECHFHNDRGMSIVNTLTAIEAGVSYADTSIWGMAERSGITSLTGILLNLFFEHQDLCKNYHLEDCYPINVLMGSILKLHVPYNEPVSLTNRTHTAVLAKSFARIFFRNSLNIGLLLVNVNTDGIRTNDELVLDIKNQQLINKTQKDKKKIAIPSMMLRLHKEGGIIPYLQKYGLKHLSDLEKF